MFEKDVDAYARQSASCQQRGSELGLIHECVCEWVLWMVKKSIGLRAFPLFVGQNFKEIGRKNNSLTDLVRSA